MDSELLQGFLAQTENYLPTIRSGILICAQTGNVYGELNTSLRQMSAIKDAALIVELDEAAQIAGELETQFKEFSSQKTLLTGEQSRALLDKLTELEASIAHLNFSSGDFSDDIADFLNESFENLGLTESVAAKIIEPVAPVFVETVETVETEDFFADEWEEEFEIDDEMLEIFGEEAEELIQNIRANLERLEKDTNQKEALLEVRRSAHTLKGSAGIVGLKELSQVAHRVEDLLDYLAENEIAGNERIFELLLLSSDCFGSLARNETSLQLTKRIEQLYTDFDALMKELKSEPIALTDNFSPVENPPETQPESLIPEAESPIEIQPEMIYLSAQIVSESNAGEIRQPADRQKTEIIKPKSEERETNTPPEISTHKSVVRVSLEKLDDLVKLVSGLVVSRSVFEQRLAELDLQIGELHNSTRRLNFATHKIETDFEAGMLDVGNRQTVVVGLRPSNFGFRASNSPSASPNAKSFDSLELDRYTEFHQTMRELIETTGDTSAINSELDSLKGNLETLFENQRQLIEQMQDKLLRLRLVSFGSLAIRLQRTVRVTADEEGKTAELIIEGGNLEVDTQILDALIEPLLHLLRNAVAHGVEPPETRRLLGKPETGKIKVTVYDEGTHFILSVTDDGRGLSAAALKARAVQRGILNESDAEKMTDQQAFTLVFHAGLTTADEISLVSGRGVGMNIVKTAVERHQGSISIESETHRGTTFTVRLPMSLAVTRALLIRTNDQTFAFPLKLVKQITEISEAELQLARKDQTITFGKTNYKFKSLGEILNLPPSDLPKTDRIRLLLIEVFGQHYALPVDEIIKPEEIVIKPLDNPLRKMPEFLGATILGDGSVVPVLELTYLLKKDVPITELPNSELEENAAIDKQQAEHEQRKAKIVLIVDDSPSVRHLTSNIIKNVGWTAIVAKDGLEALELLQDLRDLPDVILSDVEMPRMNGYELLASLKKQDNLQTIPVIMITSRANNKHRQKAVDLGVSEYLVKPFDELKLIEIIKKLSA